MKYLFFIPVSAFLFSFYTGAEKSPESIPEYEVTLIKADRGLSKGVALVIFTFLDEKGPVTKDSIRMSYNGKQVKVLPGKDGRSYLRMKAGKTRFQFYEDAEHYEIYTDSVDVKAGWQTGITVHFAIARRPMPAEKPVIYVYPDKTMDVSIRLNIQGTLHFAYPAVNAYVTFNSKETGWDFRADPDGTIHMNDKEYSYLFWDGETLLNTNEVDMHSGFFVERDSLTSFFEARLSAMGLNAREQEDFITYWCPRMQECATSFVHFMFTEDYDKVATMNVSPKPDHLFRVFMVWTDAAGMDRSAVKDQPIESFAREGFTVVEWGGGKLTGQSTVLSAE